jgi:hypothetical protein
MSIPDAQGRIVLNRSMATRYLCVESQLACMIRTTLHSASHKHEVQHQHERKNVREPADVATPPAESLDDSVADEPKRESVGN